MATRPSIKPIYALVGGDNFLQLQQLRKIMESAPAGSARIDFDGETADLANVLDEVRSFAMFSSGKVVVVTSADKFISQYRDSLENYAISPSDSATLVLRVSSLPANHRIHKLIAKTGQIIACEAPKDLPRWIIDHARSAHRLTVPPDAARTLAELVGDDLGRLDGELAKLALICDGNKVSVENVLAAVAFQREQEIYEMTNAVAAGRVTDAVKKWRQLTQVDSSAEFRAVTWLTIWLTNVRKALAMMKRGDNPGTIAQALRIWPRESQQPFFDNARKLGDTGVQRAFDLLAEIDSHSKSGIGDAKENVERFLLSLANR